MPAPPAAAPASAPGLAAGGSSGSCCRGLTLPLWRLLLFLLLLEPRVPGRHRRGRRQDVGQAALALAGPHALLLAAQL